MKLSIVIVNYNVKYFLDQCLASVYESEVDFPMEVIVIDNNSSDDSIPYIRNKYPSCKILVNGENLGFSKANNQGIRMAEGDYILLLNPDTILQKDSLSICYRFLNSHPESGAVGVKMFDGSGKFLPESKRGFPTPFVAFCKAFGISFIFPRSGIFNRYHLGHLDPEINHEIDCLSGAFMFIRREVLEKIGLLDEDFFMYGEDIDLSYRIKKAGYKIHYIAETAIIHFKGESTKKSSVRYHRHFYNAMILFAKKHFSSGSARIFQLLIRTAIYSKGVLSFLTARLGRIRNHTFDAILIAAVFIVVKYLWSLYYFGDPTYLPGSFYRINLPIYLACLVLGQYLSGAYHRPKSWMRTYGGGAIGLAAILFIYALLPTSLRSSRMVLLLGSMISIFLMGLFGYWSRKRNGEAGLGMRKILLAGEKETVTKAVRLLEKVDREISIVGFVHSQFEDAVDYLGDVRDLGPICRRFEVHEVIFCRDSYTMDALIAYINTHGKAISCKIFSDQTDSIVGSASKNSRGEIYTTDIRFRLADPLYGQWKIIFSSVVAFLLLLTFPFHFLLFKKPGRLILNCVAVLRQKLTWVGYIERDPKLGDLPSLPCSVLSHNPTPVEFSLRQIHQLNFLYAREYSVWLDTQIIFQYFRKLDGQYKPNDVD